MLYIGSCDGTFYALDRHDGDLLWSHNAKMDVDMPSFHGNVLLAGDSVVVGTDGGEEGILYAFDRATGEPLWRQTTEGGFPADTARRGSRLYALTMLGEVRCLDLESGKQHWTSGKADDERNLRSSILLVDDRLFVSLRSGTVSAFDADSGEMIWTTTIDGKLNAALARIGEALYVGDLEGRIYRLSAKDGKELGRFKAESPVYGSLLPAGDCLLALWAEKTVACLDPQLKTVRWSRTTTSTWSSFQPLVLDGRVLVGTESGEIHALDLADGSTAWTRTVEGEIKGLGSQDDVLYVGTSQGSVFAVRMDAPEP